MLFYKFLTSRSSCQAISTRADYSTKLSKPECVHALKGLALPRASHSGEIVIACSRRPRCTLAKAPVFFAHAVVTKVKIGGIISPSLYIGFCCSLRDAFLLCASAGVLHDFGDGFIHHGSHFLNLQARRVSAIHLHAAAILQSRIRLHQGVFSMLAAMPCTYDCDTVCWHVMQSLVLRVCAACFLGHIGQLVAVM